ncbi:MAG: NAD(P)-dependent glycerol-3-phosphate dehydrogenase [Gemmatimonadales bacterium]|nr:MAG: NAD(P)-dependent glycerol-3-phosphate dehydrogenase [Gemmatimonadales bacterium]
MTGQADAVRIGVLGAGSWGTALALHLHDQGHEVVLWSHDASVVEVVSRGEPNPYLPEVSLPTGLTLTADAAVALEGAGLVLSVTPAQHVGELLEQVGPLIPRDAVVVSASKGIEISTLRTMDQVMAEYLPLETLEGFTVLSGPSFALEVARRHPTAVVAASRSDRARQRVQEVFGSPRFRVYTNPDVTGVELGGAVKNVIALAAGVADGLGFGHNTRAALITRGLSEITRLGLAMGAEARTFAGLAGMGDLVLTCTGDLSRNRTVGFRLGQGESLDAILADMTAVAEGVRTTPAVHRLAARHGVDMPIVAQVYRILEGERSPARAVEELMLRDPKPEGIEP